MSVRVRYRSNVQYETNDGTNSSKYDLVSVRNWHSETTDAMYIVYLNTSDMEYCIRNMTSRREYKGGDEVNNLHVLKRHAKDRLENLGVQFSGEIRDNTSRIKGVNCGYKRDKGDADEI